MEYTYNIEGYLDLLNALKERTDNEATALFLLQEIAKDVRTEREHLGRESKLATPKQREFLDRLQVQFDPGITKAQASQLIDTALGNN